MLLKARSTLVILGLYATKIGPGKVRLDLEIHVPGEVSFRKLCDEGVAVFVKPFNQVAGERIESAVRDMSRCHQVTICWVFKGWCSCSDYGTSSYA